MNRCRRKTALVITRYPNGINEKSFYQKNAPEYMPEWIRTLPWYSRDSQRYIKFILAEEPAALAWLANQAGIEMHPWLSPKKEVGDLFAPVLTDKQDLAPVLRKLGQ